MRCWTATPQQPHTADLARAEMNTKEVSGCNPRALCRAVGPSGKRGGQEESVQGCSVAAVSPGCRCVSLRER